MQITEQSLQLKMLKSFLQMDLTNLNNRQQAAVLDAQMMQRLYCLINLWKMHQDNLMLKARIKLISLTIV